MPTVSGRPELNGLKPIGTDGRIELGTLGRLRVEGKNVSDIELLVGQVAFVSPRRRHSQKPDEVRDRIVELMGKMPRLEMFARTRTPGWDVWGNEVKGSIELPVIQRFEAGLIDSERRWRRCSTAS